MKIAACFAGDVGAARTAARRLLAAQRLRSAQSPQAFDVDSGALGWLTTFDRATAIPMMRTGAKGSLLLVSGVPVDLFGDLNDRLTRVAEGDYRAAAQSLSQLDGAFAILFWDPVNRKFVVVSGFPRHAASLRTDVPRWVLPRYRDEGHRGERSLSSRTRPTRLGDASVPRPLRRGCDLSSRSASGPSSDCHDLRRRHPSVGASTYWRWPEPGLRSGSRVSTPANFSAASATTSSRMRSPPQRRRAAEWRVRLHD